MTRDRQGLCSWLTRALACGFVLAAGPIAVGNLCGQEPAPLPRDAAARGAAAAPASWKTGAALRRELETPVSLTWTDREARAAIESLARSTGVAVFLDRRVDPGRKLTLTAKDQPLKTLLLDAAEQLDAGVTLVGSVAYLGPKATASKLLALAGLRRQDAGKLAAEARIRLVKSEAWDWQELAQPRQLLDELALAGRVKIANPEAVPLDLWPAASWPALPWTERMTLLLAGFDLTYEHTGPGSIRLVPLPEKLVFERTYSPTGDADRVAIDLRRLAPEAKIAVERGALRVVAEAAVHARIERLLRGETVKTTQAGTPMKRYTLTVENQPAGAVLKTLAVQIGKELKYDASVGEKLQQTVTFKVDKIPLEELLDKTLRPLGLGWKLGDEALEVVPQ